MMVEGGLVTLGVLAWTLLRWADARHREAAPARARGRARRRARARARRARGRGRPRRPPRGADLEQAREHGNRFLYLTVFVVGISTLGAEIAAARLLAPFFGASTIVWANTIGVVLVALSVGYWYGGRLGDRYPRLRQLCQVVLGGAVLLALIPFVAQPFFEVSIDALDEIEAGAFVGSLFAVLFLIAIPLAVLGTVSPWAIRLRGPRRRARRSGRRAPLRDLDRRLAARDDARGAGPDPVRRNPAHLRRRSR